MADSTQTSAKVSEVTGLYDRYVMATYGRFPVVFERGQGVYLWDTDGRRYLDFLAGIAVNGVGHCHPKVVEAVQRQCAKLMHVSNLYLIEQQAELAQALCGMCGMEKAFFANSGAEANEAALKIARKLGNAASPDKTWIVAAVNSFHGRTLGTLAITGQEKYQKPYVPLVPDVTLIPYNDTAALEAAVDDRTCAVILEPVQGEGGVLPAAPEFLRAAREAADRHGALMILDEIQSGRGRTGEFLACQAYGVVPDIVTLAKTMGGGFPIAACLARGKAAEAFVPGDHGTTFGGGPLACAAALAAVRAIESEGLSARAREMGAAVQSGLEALKAKHGGVEVRGMGLMQALVLGSPVARDVVQAAFRKGLLANAVGPGIVRLLPPLVVNQQQIDEGMEILDSAIAETVA